jgi:long-chain acyl-CoA synthetase
MSREPETALQVFRENARCRPNDTQLIYFDTALTMREIDEMSDALAAALAAKGIGTGDRVAAFMQNMPHFVITLLAAWKVGAIFVPVNPMLQGDELKHQLNDCGAVVLVALDVLWPASAKHVVQVTSVHTVIAVSARSMQQRNDGRVLADASVETTTGALDFDELIEKFRGSRPEPQDPVAEDVAFICYTSGTTGEPKGAMCSHRNVVSVAQAIRDVTQINSESRILALAPLFHITGLMVELLPALTSPCPLILSFRFHPEVMLESIREHRPTFAVGPITAYIGLLQSPGFNKEDFETFDRVYSGGAPISQASAKAFEERTGRQLLGAYGMTEATAATHLTPNGKRPPVDPNTGALAVGLPTPGTTVRIVDECGKPVPIGTPGEVVLASPGVISGYWQRPDATAATIRDGVLYSGDIGIVDSDGWLFVVDRKKDLINCSGFKVWPREVEDALYEHPAVMEAAVVGVPDPYRGETIKAYVSLKDPGSIDSAGLIEFLADRLAAYKRPREIEIMASLPKNSSGKILRRVLRDATPSALPTATFN